MDSLMYKIQQALACEKLFYNEKNLLITLHQKGLNKNAIHTLHDNIANVRILDPVFMPKQRCLIGLKDSNDVAEVKKKLLSHTYENGYLTVDVIQNTYNNSKDIDPYALHVQNIPDSMTDKDICVLFPNRKNYKFYPFNHSLIVHFHHAEDAIEAYQSVHNVSYKANVLLAEFHRKNVVINKEAVIIEDDDDEEPTEIIVEEANTKQSSNKNSKTKLQEVEVEAEKNEEGSNTILVHNLSSTTTPSELMDLFQSCCHYTFLKSESNTFTCKLQFDNVESAVTAYNVALHEHDLQVEYFYDHDGQNNSDSEIIDQENSKMSCRLYIENLPNSIADEDMKTLCPAYQKYKIINNDFNKSSISVLVWFQSKHDAKIAYRSINGLTYKTNCLKCSIQDNNLLMNPIALIKRKTAVDNSSTAKKLKENEEEVIEDLPNEDDIECESEEEEHVEDCFVLREEDKLVDDDEDEYNNDTEDVKCQDELDDQNTCFRTEDDDLLK